jgi:hypothetical protein
MGSNPFSACRQGTGKSAGFGAGQSDPGGCLAGDFFTTAILGVELSRGTYAGQSSA